MALWDLSWNNTVLASPEVAPHPEPGLQETEEGRGRSGWLISGCPNSLLPPAPCLTGHAPNVGSHPHVFFIFALIVPTIRSACVPMWGRGGGGWLAVLSVLPASMCTGPKHSQLSLALPLFGQLD